MFLSQRVKTHRGETGVIVAECTRPEWDWWVEIRFIAKGEYRTCKEPFLESELEVIDASEN